MASEQKITVKGETNVEEIEFVDTFYSAQILQKLMEHRKDYRKTLADFNNDYSKYEFAYIAYTYRQLGDIIDERMRELRRYFKDELEVLEQ